MIVHNLAAEKAVALELTDSALACQTLYKTYGRSLLKMMKNTEHGRYLTEIGFLEDIKIAAAVDSYAILPVLSGNVIKLKRDETRHADGENTPSSKPSA
jgi:phosphosulfolactate phosphohydrolase-like enzyme